MFNQALKIYLAALLFFPSVAGAFIFGNSGIEQVIQRITGTLNIIIGALFVLATVVFLFGVVKFIASASDPAAREKSKGIMWWGIIGLAVMAAAWGVANILIDNLGVGRVGQHGSSRWLP